MKLLLIDEAKQIIDIDYAVVVDDKHVRLFPSEHFSIDKWHTGYVLPDDSDNYYKFRYSATELTIGFWYLRPYIDIKEQDEGNKFL